MTDTFVCYSDDTRHVKVSIYMGLGVRFSDLSFGRLSRQSLAKLLQNVLKSKSSLKCWRGWPWHSVQDPVEVVADPSVDTGELWPSTASTIADYSNQVGFLGFFISPPEGATRVSLAWILATSSVDPSTQLFLTHPGVGLFTFLHCHCLDSDCSQDFGGTTSFYKCSPPCHCDWCWGDVVVFPFPG